jgi:hypothetical protein
VNGGSSVHQVAKHRWRDGLLAVRERFIWMRVHFYEESIGACGNGGNTHGEDKVAAAGGVTGVDYDRQMGERSQERYAGKIEDVTGLLIEAPHTALAQDDVSIAFSQNIFGCQQPFLDGRGEATLEQHWSSGSPNRPQEGKILHIPAAYLEHVGQLGYCGYQLRLHHFRDNR